MTPTPLRCPPFFHIQEGPCGAGLGRGGGVMGERTSPQTTLPVGKQFGSEAPCAGTRTGGTFPRQRGPRGPRGHRAGRGPGGRQAGARGSGHGLEVAAGFKKNVTEARTRSGPRHRRPGQDMPQQAGRLGNDSGHRRQRTSLACCALGENTVLPSDVVTSVILVMDGQAVVRRPQTGL